MQYPVDIQDIKVAVDVVAFSYFKNTLNLLLVQRKYEPFAERWVIPGGFVNTDESLEDAAIRELREETNYSDEIEFFTQAGAYGEVERDPRRRIISVAYMILLNELPEVKGETDAQDAKWWPVKDLPKPLAFDHDFILEKAMNKLRYLVRDTDAGKYLLPEIFSHAEFTDLLRDSLGTKHDVTSDINSLLKREILEEEDGKLSYA